MTDNDLPRLVAAPELIVLDLVDDTLVALEHALVAANPSLVGRPPCEPTPIHRRARSILRRAQRLHRALDNYRAEADQILDESAGTADDIPF